MIQSVTLPAPFVSIVVPVYNDAKNLPRCLAALTETADFAQNEILVVDDASIDVSAAVADRFAVRVIRRPRNGGPGAARNEGVRAARGHIVLFIDSDVVVGRQTISRVVEAFTKDPELGAIFGSYDDRPAAPALVSRYRNLLHHFVHQQASTEAWTFWAGCGAVRRSAFDAVGGFSEEGRWSGKCEDVELGTRLHLAGYRIRLDRHLQVTHLKCWTVRSVIATDILHRAVPWARLIHERRHVAWDLNLRVEHRVSGMLTVLAAVSAILAFAYPPLWIVALTSLLATIALNRRLYCFFFDRGGAPLLSVAIPMHLLYYLYSSFTYLAMGIWLTGRRWLHPNPVHPAALGAANQCNGTRAR